MPEFKLREASPDDAGAMAQLWLEATLEVAQHEPIYKPHLNHADSSERLAEEFSEGSKKAFVVFADEALAAYVTRWCSTHPSHLTACKAYDLGAGACTARLTQLILNVLKSLSSTHYSTFARNETKSRHAEV